MENPNDPIRNRTRDLPACRAVAQPTALPRAPKSICSTLWNRVTSIRNIMKSLFYPLVTLLNTFHASMKFWATSCVACRVSGASQSLNKPNILNKGNYVLEYPSTRTACIPIFCLSINYSKASPVHPFWLGESLVRVCLMDVSFQACTIRVAQCWSSEFLHSEG